MSTFFPKILLGIWQKSVVLPTYSASISRAEIKRKQNIKQTSWWARAPLLSRHFSSHLLSLAVTHSPRKLQVKVKHFHANAFV